MKNGYQLVSNILNESKLTPFQRGLRSGKLLKRFTPPVKGEPLPGYREKSFDAQKNIVLKIIKHQDAKNKLISNLGPLKSQEYKHGIERAIHGPRGHNLTFKKLSNETPEGKVIAGRYFSSNQLPTRIGPGGEIQAFGQYHD